MAATGTTVAMPMSGDKEEPGKRLSVWERWPEQAAWREASQRSMMFPAGPARGARVWFSCLIKQHRQRG